MDRIEVTVKMFQSKINVINFASISGDNVTKARDDVCVYSHLQFWGIDLQIVKKGYIT